MESDPRRVLRRVVGCGGRPGGVLDEAQRGDEGALRGVLRQTRQHADQSDEQGEHEEAQVQRQRRPGQREHPGAAQGQGGPHRVT